MNPRLSIVGHMRKPLIKFIGVRLPRPHYDRSALPSFVCNSKSSSMSEGPSSLLNASSSAVKAKMQRGELIEDWQLPAFLRRKQISEEECHAINSGSAYGLGST